MKLSKMQCKVVVDLMSGEMLGFISDVEFELRNYQIRYFDVEPKRRCVEKICPWLFKTRTIRIHVDQIESIGNDVILVRVRKKNER